MATNIAISPSLDQFNFNNLMLNSDRIRNICILAHVDHGKTTFADSLIASNGIISFRDVGKLNYMDFREDEQIRKITMKSSAISLIYSPKYDLSDCNFLINLIDSPGHIDFSAEVSTAVRFSDGAFLVIDVVEGICPQTLSVIKQINLEYLSPCLVLNKIDKLILNLNLSPTEAFYHLYQLLEQINALMASFETLKDSQSQSSIHFNTLSHDSEEFDSCQDRNIFFSPQKGNVMFTSSFDGWGFILNNFVHILSKQLGFSKKVLSKTLWGDYYLHFKTRRILPNAKAKGKKPLFASFVLDYIWSIYKYVIISKDISKVKTIIQKLELSVSLRVLRHSDNRIILQSVLQQWLPLSEAALRMAIEHIPPPRCLSNNRIERFLINNTFQEFENLPCSVKKLKHCLQKCESLENIHQVTFVSKMMPFPKDAFQFFQDDNCILSNTVHTDSNNKYCLLAFARVISGTLRKGQKLYVLHPRYDPRDNPPIIEEPLPNSDSSLLNSLPNVSLVNIVNLFIFMGRELKPVESIPAGNICGIGGLDHLVLRNCTLSNTIYCMPFCPIFFEANPILKVSLEPIHISDMEPLVCGLKSLSQVDPCVEIGIEESGEHVISCAGEVHLKKCIEDLKKYFAYDIDFEVSAPIIPFRETIIALEDTIMLKEPIIGENYLNSEHFEIKNNNDLLGNVSNKTPNKQFEITIRASPLPLFVVQCLQQNFKLLRMINSHNSRSENPNIVCENSQELTTLRKELKFHFRNSGQLSENIVDRIWSFGPKPNCPNILLNNVDGYKRISIWPDLYGEQKIEKNMGFMDLDSSVVQGFLASILQGPLCNEPIFGVCFFVESLKFVNLVESQSLESYNVLQNDPTQLIKIPYGPLSGQVISTVIKTCRQAFLSQPARLMYPIYSCSLQCTQEAMGSMMAVINRRGGKCIYQDVQIGTNTFMIETYIPVIESFGFSDEIRKKTSGLANPQLIFSHWEIITSDPFWVPSTNEELLHFGVKADFENVAKKYMDNIRKRKGLAISSKLVEFPEKQRNIKK